ncbi:hypothetical protein SLEP1_g56386 [Rubroshorea leprosula]|uniref:Uncharacterized protein n=1 Tax=Rubroshorea leprosula TaxID=152421 RepID=A0AAV5MMI3_9ROSI|nr:hypothetical protein SLEP1_g56386 [Rubroshorea leprosula]
MEVENMKNWKYILSSARGTAFCTLRPTLLLSLGHVILVRPEVALQSLNNLTWPNEGGSVGRRVQEASVPSTAHTYFIV